MNYSQDLQIAIKIAKNAGNILKKYQHTNLKVEQKSDETFVTKVDRETENYIATELKKSFPKSLFFGEESHDSNPDFDTARKAGDIWIVDPLDGTNNYVLGIPHFCISMGRMQNGIPTLGVIYNPITDELFCAEKSRGAFFNDSPMSFTPCPIRSIILGRFFSETINAYGLETNLKEIYKHLSKYDAVRSYGAAALDIAFVAHGRSRIFWQRGLKAWDVCAGYVLLKELGYQILNEDRIEFDIFKDENLIVGCDSLEMEELIQLFNPK